MHAISLREASRQLRLNPHYVKGFAQALGIRLQPAAGALLMTASDFKRLERRVNEMGPSQAIAN